MCPVFVVQVFFTITCITCIKVRFNVTLSVPKYKGPAFVVVGAMRLAVFEIIIIDALKNT